MLAHEGGAVLWSNASVRCVLVPHGRQVEVELRNADGSAFLRKTAPTRQAALNEAEYLRLLVRAGASTTPATALKPFVLVIEDDPDNRDALSEALRLSGMRALGCRTGEEGLVHARVLAPDLIVLDDRLPEVTGDVCRRLRADPLTASMPVIAVSAAPEALRAAGCQADAVLAKPCPLDTLVSTARLFLRHVAQAPGAGV